MNDVAELRAIKADAQRHRDRRVGDADRARRASRRDRALSGGRAGGRHRSPARPTATWARSAAISASTRAASSTIRANGGAAPTITVSRPPAKFATSRRRAAASASRPSAATSRRRLLTLGAEVDLAGPAGPPHRAAQQLYIGFARQDVPVTETHGRRQVLSRRCGPGEFVTAVRAKNTPGFVGLRQDPHPPLDRISGRRRRRRAAPRRRELADLRVAFTGTNPRPVLLAGTAELCGGPLDEKVLKRLDDLVRDQVMAMKTTFTPGHYRRRVAGVLGTPARRASIRGLNEGEDPRFAVAPAEGGGALTEEFSRRRPYNAASEFIDANVARGLGSKLAFVGSANAR